MRSTSLASRTFGHANTKTICNSILSSRERIGSDGSLHITPAEQRGTARSGKAVGHVPDASPMSPSQHDELVEALSDARRVIVLTGEV